MRLVFMGTPSFAVPTLERVVQAGHEVLAVYTQPDRPKGRGGKPAASPVKQAAIGLGLEVRQPERIRRPEVVAELAAMNTDAMVVVGYGQIIPQAIIDLPRQGIINVHASLLPKYRGAAPIQWAVANGETLTGVTTMRIDAGLDTGDMLLKWETPIGADEDALQLSARLAPAGADLLVRTLAEAPAPQPQDNSQATYAPILKKEDGLIDWNQSASAIFNRSRGFLPWPGAWTYLRGQVFHVWRSRVAPGSGAPGTVVADRSKLVVHCGDQTALELLEVQLEGRKRIDAAAFLNGWKPEPNEALGK
ncbi:MAG TPA: methionyl-tRNA formyltransferase [Bryobacteraceae bacterium]|nr:methionyl-tRNA formyltransferase [Bryobacteraceae bacterium]